MSGTDIRQIVVVQVAQRGPDRQVVVAVDDGQARVHDGLRAPLQMLGQRRPLPCCGCWLDDPKGGGPAWLQACSTPPLAVSGMKAATGGWTCEERSGRWRTPCAAVARPCVARGIAARQAGSHR